VRLGGSNLSRLTALIGLEYLTGRRRKHIKQMVILGIKFYVQRKKKRED
jgi:hypothetical protein